ncbi:MAG: RnfABCDGE type electron transport complex subunit G [Ghiorsea sp.]
MTFDKEQQKIALALFVVATLAVSSLALFNQITKEPIRLAQEKALHQALAKVLPQHSNNPLHDAFSFPINQQENLQIFPAKDQQGKIKAFAWQQIAPNGYSGSIRILMGVSIQGEVVAIRITQHKETPGLGDGITNNIPWLNTFINTTLRSTQWAVKKDGGDFDQFTGATITPRAVVHAVHEGLVFYQAQQHAILKAAVVVKPSVK